MYRNSNFRSSINLNPSKADIADPTITSGRKSTREQRRSVRRKEPKTSDLDIHRTLEGNFQTTFFEL